MRALQANGKADETTRPGSVDSEPTHDSYFKFVTGKSCLDREKTRETKVVAGLERFVDRCPDVFRVRFKSIEMHPVTEGVPRSEIVHAQVDCDWETRLVNIHDDLPSRLASSRLLENTALQLGCRWHVVTTMMLECASSRFSTLMAVADHQYLELGRNDVDLLIARYRQVTLPKIHHFVSCFGGGRTGLTKTMTAVANGYLRLGRHNVLSMTVSVHPGPLLPKVGPSSPGGRTHPAHNVRSLAA